MKSARKHERETGIGGVKVMENTVTQEHIDCLLDRADIEIDTFFGKCTVLVCRLENGFVLVESSACVDPDNYDHELGVKVCMDKIKNKLWELEGYMLQSHLAK